MCYNFKSDLQMKMAIILEIAKTFNSGNGFYIDNREPIDEYGNPLPINLSKDDYDDDGKYHSINFKIEIMGNNDLLVYWTIGDGDAGSKIGTVYRKHPYVADEKDDMYVHRLGDEAFKIIDNWLKGIDND